MGPGGLREGAPLCAWQGGRRGCKLSKRGLCSTVCLDIVLERCSLRSLPLQRIRYNSGEDACLSVGFGGHTAPVHTGSVIHTLWMNK